MDTLVSGKVDCAPKLNNESDEELSISEQDLSTDNLNIEINIDL